MKEINLEAQNDKNMFHFHKKKSTFQFLSYTVAVFILFLIYGYFQELIFQLDGFRPYGFYLTLYQFLLYVLFSFCERLIKKETSRRVPLKIYVLLAGLTVGTMGFSNASVGYLNYPTQVVFKCCKLIPVLIGGIFIQGKVHGIGDFSAAILMSIGLTLFTLADSQVSPNFNFTGVTLISIALTADAMIGNVQEKTLKSYSPSNSEMIFYSYAIGFFYLLFILIIAGQLKVAFQFSSEHATNVYGYGFLFSFSGYCGVNLVLTLVELYGAFTAVTVTTCRKALTIALSFLLFSKPFTLQYLWSGMLIVCGIYVQIYCKKYHSSQTVKYWKEKCNCYKYFKTQSISHSIEV